MLDILCRSVPDKNMKRENQFEIEYIIAMTLK